MNSPNATTTLLQELSISKGMDWRRFRELCGRCCVTDDVAQQRRIYDDLRRRYDEPQRFYHRFDHIVHCLQQLDLVTGQLADPGSVEMALWFHDAIYVPGAADNEQASVDLLISAISGLTTKAFIDRVSNLVLVTIYGATPNDRDAEFVCDIDMSSFGVEWALFYKDSVNVRAEQSQVADADYFRGHLAFLSSLLSRKAIFFTPFFQHLYEQQARTNIDQLIRLINEHGTYQGFSA